MTTLLQRFTARQIFGFVVVLIALVHGLAADEDGDGSARSDDAGSPATIARDADQADAAHDPRLIGSWRHTDAYASGDFTAAVDDLLHLFGDGTYREGGRAAAGDAAASFVGDSQEGADGAWQTADRIFYVRPAGGAEWQPLARYGLTDDGSTMMFTFGNGAKQIWNRL